MTERKLSGQAPSVPCEMSSQKPMLQHGVGMGQGKIVQYGMVVPWTPAKVHFKSENAEDIFLILSSTVQYVSRLCISVQQCLLILGSKRSLTSKNPITLVVCLNQDNAFSVRKAKKKQKADYNQGWSPVVGRGMAPSGEASPCQSMLQFVDQPKSYNKAACNL